MALFEREFIAVPDDHKGVMVYKWPDVSIRKFTRAIVNADEVALFVNTGKVMATLPPGRHQIDADEIPGLGILIDAATGGNAYRAELYFVGSREFTGFTFGGRIDDVQDRQTGLIVTLRVFGDYALRVIDPAQLVTNLVGTVDVTDNARVTDWVSDQLLKVMRTDITTQIVRNGWPILGLSAYTTDIEKAVIERTNVALGPAASKKNECSPRRRPRIPPRQVISRPASTRTMVTVIRSGTERGFGRMRRWRRSPICIGRIGPRRGRKD